MSPDSQQPNGPARTVSAEQLATERLLRAAVEALRELLAADLEAGLRGALRALAEGTGLDRVYAVRYDHAARAGFLGAEHASPLIASATEAMSAGPYGYAEFEVVWRPLMAGEVYTSSVAAKTGATAELNRAAGVKSDLLVPVFVGGVFWGALGFDDCTTERVYCEAKIQVLRAAAAALAAAIKHDETVRAALAEREARAAELADLNRELERSNRLLAASAQAGALLSAREDFDVAAVEAIGLVADAAEFDRAVLIEHLDAHGNPGTEFWRVTHEWHRPGVAAQSGSEVGGGRFSDAPKFVADLLLSPTTVEFATSEIEDEVFRRVQEKLGARLLVAGNIVIDGFSWGAFCCDDCTTERRRTAEEKGVIADAARAVGQALYRRRLESRAEMLERQVLTERAQAARDRAAQLTAENEALTRALARLASEPEIARVPEALLIEIARSADAEVASWFDYDAAANVLTHSLRVQAEKLLAGPVADEPALIHGTFDADITPVFRALCETDELMILDATVESHPVAWPGVLEWHRKNGRLGVGAFVIKVGNQPLGLLGLGFSHRRALSAAQEHLIRALSNQFALAMKVVRLADQARGAAVLAERNRIARDLHDTLAQGFTGVLAQLGAMEGALETGSLGATVHYLERARELARFSLAEARSSVHALRPETNAAPLATRLRHMLAAVTHGTGLETSVQEEGRPGVLNPAGDWCVHKFVQEALANAVKHSGARHFGVELAWGEECSACVWDDGRGFDPATTVPGLGLLSMRERAAEAGGRLLNESRSGAGTRLCLFLPLPNSNPA